MTRRFASLAAATLALLSAAAAAAATPPPAGGTIAILPRTADGEYAPALNVFVDATTAALEARGFTRLDDPAHAAFVAELTLAEADVGTGLGRDPHPDKVSVGPGVIVPLSTGKSSVVTLQRTRLELTIRKRGEQVAAWRGAAVTVRAAPASEREEKALAADVSAGLLRSYPAQAEGVVPVP